MLNFDPEKLRSVYVWIAKVTQEYVYVVSHRNGEEFAPKGSTAARHRGRDIRKIKIHPTVFQAYKSLNTSTEFYEPRLAALNYYGSTIVSVETQMYSRVKKGFQNPDNWQSFFARSIKRIRNIVPETAYINGHDIFWFEDNASTARLDPKGDDAFSLVACKRIRLGSLGRPTRMREAFNLQTLAENFDDEESLKQLDDKLAVNPVDGIVLRYKPAEDVTVYSPVLAAIPGLFGKTDTSDREDAEGKMMIRSLYEMCSHSNPSQANMLFLMKSADVIGRLYGMEKTEFLNIPEVVMATSHTSFHDIPKEQQAMTPIGRSAVEAISWLLGFMYRETDISKLRDLSRAMRYCLKNGLMPMNEDSAVKDEASMDDLPSVTYKGNGEAEGLPESNKAGSFAAMLERYQQTHNVA